MKRFLISSILVFSILVTKAQINSEKDDFSKQTIQIGVVVSDLEKSLDFYTDVVGMQKTGAFTVDINKAKALGLSNKHSLDVTILKLNNTPQANEYKIMSFGNKPGHKKPTWLHDDNGIQYITIFVNHLNPFIERMKSNDIQILSEIPADLGNGRFLILIQDPDGTFIELIGPK